MRNKGKYSSLEPGRSPWELKGILEDNSTATLSKEMILQRHRPEQVAAKKQQVPFSLPQIASKLRLEFLFLVSCSFFSTESPSKPNPDDFLQVSGISPERVNVCKPVPLSVLSFFSRQFIWMRSLMPGSL